MPAKRQDVNINIPSTSLQTTGASVDTFAPIEKMEVRKSKLSSAMDALSDSIPAFSQFASDIQKEVETDKTLNMNRALLGKEPTHNATKEGRKTQKIVQVRNVAAKEIGRLKQMLSSGLYTDEEYNSIIAQAQDNVAKWTGDDGDLLAAGASYFRESLPALAELRGQNAEKKRQESLYFTNQESLVLATKGDYTPEDVRKNVSKVVTEMAKQGITAETMRKTIMDTAAEQAKNKDLTLMDWVKEQKPEWYRNSGALQQADKTAHELFFNDSQGAVAATKSEIEAQFTSNQMLTEDEWYKQAGSLRLYDKPLYTETQMRAFWNGLQKKRNDGTTVDMLFEQMITASSDPEADPLQVISGRPLKQKEEVALVNKFDKLQERQASDWSTSHPEADEEEKQNFIAKQHREKADTIIRSGLTDPSWKEKMSVLDVRDFNNLKPGVDKLPVGVKNTLSLMDDLKDNPAALSAHASDKAISMAENFRLNMLSGMDEVQAYQFAYKTAHQKINLTSDEKQKITKRGVSVVESNYDQWFDGNEDMPDKQKESVSKRISKRITDLYSAGIPLETAETMAGKEFQQTHFQLASGKVVTGNLSTISRIGDVSQKRALEILDNLPDRIINDFEEDDSFVLDPYTPIEDWYPVITPDGGVYFTDPSGSIRITKTMTFNQAAGKSNAAKAKELLEEKQRIEEHQRKQGSSESLGWPTKWNEAVKNPYSMWDK